MSTHLLLLAPLSLLRLELLSRALPVGRQLVDVARQLLVGSGGLVELLAKHRVHVTQTRRALLLLLQLDERRFDVHVVIGLADAQTILARIESTLQLVVTLRHLSSTNTHASQRLLIGPDTDLAIYSSFE